MRVGLDPNDIAIPHTVNEPFIQAMNRELKHVNEFFLCKLDEYDSYLHKLTDQVEIYNNLSKRERDKKKVVLDNTFNHIIQQVDCLESYREFNLLGCRKIIKKFAKQPYVNRQPVVKFTDEVQASPVNNSIGTYKLKSELEELYSHTFGVAIHVAREKIRYSVGSGKPSEYVKVGFYAGLLTMTVTILTVLILWHFEELYHSEEIQVVFPVFRCTLVLSSLIGCWGVCVVIYNRYRINYVYLMGLNPRTTLAPLQILKVCMLCMLIVLISLTLYLATYLEIIYLLPEPLNSRWGWIINARLFPALQFVLLFGLTIIPLRGAHLKSRRVLVWTVFNVVIAPFGKLGLREFFVGDIITSLIKPMGDMVYSVCFIGSLRIFRQDLDEGPICDAISFYMLPLVSFFPFFWRMMQCLRRAVVLKEAVHVLNCMKYMTGMIVILMGILSGELWAFEFSNSRSVLLQFLWLCSTVVSTICMYSWDVFVDWRFFRWWKADKRLFLREKVGYPFTWYMYWMIVSNFFARFTWSLTVSQKKIFPGNASQIFILVISMVEVLRRFQWALIRVENEHLNNVGHYRTSMEVPMPFSAHQEGSAIEDVATVDLLTALKAVMRKNAHMTASQHREIGGGSPRSISDTESQSSLSVSSAPGARRRHGSRKSSRRKHMSSDRSRRKKEEPSDRTRLLDAIRTHRRNPPSMTSVPSISSDEEDLPEDADAATPELIVGSLNRGPSSFIPSEGEEEIQTP